jgi:hypothetical protein
MNIWLHNILYDFFYPFKTQGRIILGHTVFLLNSHAQTAIYDSKKKLFLKQGISCQLGRGWTQLFDLNARIQQLTWSLIFYEKYSTSQSYLWFWPPLILGGSVISDGTIHDLKRVKVPGTGPLWNPWGWIYYVLKLKDGYLFHGAIV